MKRIASVALALARRGDAAQRPGAGLAVPGPDPHPLATGGGSSPASDEFEPTKDLIDVIRGLRHKPPPPPPDPADYKKRMVAGSPVVGYSPTTGVSAGFAGNVAFYRGFPQTTRISSIVASATATTKAQFLVSAKFNVSSLENRWRIEADNRFFWTSQPTYGLGTSTPEDAEARHEVQPLPDLRQVLQAGPPQRLPGRGLRLQHPQQRPPSRRSRSRGVRRLALHHLLGAVRLRPRLPDLRRLQPAYPSRQP